MPTCRHRLLAYRGINHLCDDLPQYFKFVRWILTSSLKKFHRGKRDKFYSKDPYFLCHKTLRDGIETCLSMRRLTNRGPQVIIWHVYFGLAKSLDIEHKRYWTSVALYSIVARASNRVHTLKRFISRNPCKHHRNAALWQI